MIVAGVDFGTLSVRVTLMDCDDGATLGGAVASYPLKRSAADPLLGAQSHDDQMDALARAMRAFAEDPSLSRRMGAEARRQVCARHDVDLVNRMILTATGLEVEGARPVLEREAAA